MIASQQAASAEQHDDTAAPTAPGAAARAPVLEVNKIAANTYFFMIISTGVGFILTYSNIE